MLFPHVSSGYSTFDPQADVPNLTGKVILVTGANSGVGFSAASLLAKHGATVYIGARDETRGKAAVAKIEAELASISTRGTVKWVRIDVSSPLKAKASAEAFLANENRLDILINNAGIGWRPYETVPEGGIAINKLMVVNHLGPFVLTQALTPILEKTAKLPDSDVRIIAVSSDAHNIVPSNLNFRDLEGWNVLGDSTLMEARRYGMSKLANILWIKELQSRFEASQTPITCVAIHPGLVRTEGLVRLSTEKGIIGFILVWLSGIFGLSPERGGYTTVYAATTENKDGLRGKYVIPFNRASPSKVRQHPALADFAPPMTFTPTQPERQLVAAFFNRADPQKLGIIHGESAVRILAGANLPPMVLGEIWAIADKDNNGFLTRKEVAVVIRLVGWAQKGERISEDLLSRAGPLPTIEGLALPESASPVQSNPTLRAPSWDAPLLSADDRAKFVRLFRTCGPSEYGLLPGDKARDMFLKSQLPMEKLGRIWDLADTQSRGELDQTDFVIGMYLIQSAMSNMGFIIPTSLPAGLYDAASSVTSPVSPSYNGIGQSIFAHNIDQALQSPQRTGGAASYSFTLNTPSFISSSQPAATWDISTQEKATADSFFNTLDSERRGFIEGDIAMHFLTQSGLPDDHLARVWNLADTNQDGRLTQDGFAIAFHLIKGKLAEKDVPDMLPSNLIPPSKRSSQPQPQAQTTSIQKDLWLIDDTPAASTNNSSMPFYSQRSGDRSNSPSPSPRPWVTFQHDFLGDDDEPAPMTPGASDHSFQIGNRQTGRRPIS